MCGKIVDISIGVNSTVFDMCDFNISTCVGRLLILVLV